MKRKMRPRLSGTKRVTGGRPPVSLGVLLLGILLLVGAAWQAISAGRAQERTVTRVLQSYASVAAWNFEQHATSLLSGIVEPVFHRPLHEASFEDGSRAPVSAGELVADRTDLEECGLELIDATRYAARIPLNTDRFQTTATVDRAAMGALADELRAHYRRTPQKHRITGRETIHAFELGDSAVVVIYSSKVVPNDTLLYALVMDPARLAPTFGRMASAGNLLPDPLVEGVPRAELLSLGLQLPGSQRVIYGDARAGERTGARPLPRLGGLIVLAELQPGAEAHLILGDSPATRVQFLLGMLTLAIGLLIIAFSQIRREHALSRMRADFVSSVSHELRTPLALQRVFLDTLRLGRVTTAEKRQWCFDNIDRESMRLAHLVENVLHFSRAQQGTMQVHPEEARLAPVIEEIIRAFEPLAATAGAHVQADLDPSVSAPVDAIALRQVLMNFLENAVKYGATGGRVTVSLTLHGRLARMTVDDEGTGVPPEERDSIFEAHRRGNRAITSAVAGSGIGLAVVRELVAGHGGRVFVTESTAGGARFVVELPNARRVAAGAASVAGADALAADAGAAQAADVTHTADDTLTAAAHVTG